MRTNLRTVLFIGVVFISGCGGSVTTTNNTKLTNAAARPKPTVTQSQVANGDYPGKGKVTKINLELGSVEMDHEEIAGVMPAMRMEFYASDKKMLDGLKVGDTVDFTLRYKDHTETVVGISKAK
jgi:Cu/Ag efflux protein CusF